MKNTIVVNLFAGPGAGKSTGAAYIFSELKLAGIDCEYVSEFAKDKVWENNKEVFNCQFYITGKQAYKIARCYGKVDVIITDSPIAIGAQYLEFGEENLGFAILDEFQKYNNLNFFIKRVKKYNPNGRNQTDEESRKIDEGTKGWLKLNNIEFDEITGDEIGYDNAVKMIINRINNRDDESGISCGDYLKQLLVPYEKCINMVKGDDTQITTSNFMLYELANQLRKLDNNLKELKEFAESEQMKNMRWK